MIWQLDGDVYRLACSLGESPEYRRLLERKTIARASGATAADEIGMVGLVGLERRTVVITDARADPRYEWPEALQLGGQRSMLGVPMLAGDQAIGIIVLQRRTVDPFDERTIRLATTFAAQGSIAIQNVQLFREMERRGGELARSVDELRVLGEISQAVSSSLDLDEVLTTIVARAVELSGAEGGSIFEFDDETSLFGIRASFGTDEELVEKIRHVRIHLLETFLGRVRPPASPATRPTSIRNRAIRMSTSSVGPDGAPCSSFRCCENSRSSVPLWCAGAPPGRSPNKPQTFWRHLPANRRLLYTMLACTESWKRNPDNSRW